jgi:transcription elongation factor GreA
MAEKKVFLTREGYDKLHEELEYLKGGKRRKISKDIAEARAHGDLSENAEYDAAKEAQALNEKKVAELEDTLSRAEIIKKDAASNGKVSLGTTVKVKDKNSGEEFDYMIVSEEEADFEANKISTSSPVGKAFLGAKTGDVVEITVPAGTLEYEIISVS